MWNVAEQLKNQVAAITGGGGAIGTAFAGGLVEAGVRVAILDLDGKKAANLARSLAEGNESEVIGISCDVLDKDSVIKADREITERLGPLAFLVNCAGGNCEAATTRAEQVSSDLKDLTESFFGIDVEGFRQALDLNLLGTVLPCSILGKSIVEHGGGAIVNISSMNAFRPLTRIPAYSAGKSAVSNFTEWLAVHLAPAKVRVNAIAPGFFLTEQLKYLAYQEDGELTPRYERVLANTPMGRFGDPEELVGTLLYLLSDCSRFVTGVVIPVDGGFNVYSGV
jgi:NAD(P)-dependent dehydrogenase (short-subunit alcohol dehydrogenase family)